MFFIDNKGITDPRINLAIEEYALNTMDVEKDSFLLFYINQPSIIIGRNQNTIEEINTEFVEINQLKSLYLDNHVQCKSFNGSMASTGDTTHVFKEQLIPTTSNNLYLSSDVSLYVTKLVSADVILGCSWLKLTNTIVRGRDNQIIVRGSDNLETNCLFDTNNKSLWTDDNINDAAMLTEKYADIFTTKSLSNLLPHCKGFDCKFNLKKDASPPFGKVYNLSKDERDALQGYIDEN